MTKRGEKIKFTFVNFVRFFFLEILHFFRKKKKLILELIFLIRFLAGDGLNINGS